jgi:hypothetical protein
MPPNSDGHSSQTPPLPMWTIPFVTADALTRTVQDFLSEASGAVVLENGAVAFDLSQAKYSISGEFNKCLLHLWSAERNTVRRVLGAEMKHGTLELFVQRLGQPRPTKLEICREHDRRSPSAKRAGYATFYALHSLFPSHLRYAFRYGWVVNLVAILVSAAMEAPLFIGFSLLADPEFLDASSLPRF